MQHSKPCVHCGSEMSVRSCELARKRFCSKRCNILHHIDDLHRAAQGKHRAPSTCFKPGHATWNKGVKGRHHCRRTEFKKGLIPKNLMPVGTEMVRVRKTRDDTRVWVKVAEPRVWRLRARVVWEKHNGPVPKGKLIHHEDRDKLNDDISNLRLMTRREHAREHAAETILLSRRAPAGNALISDD